MRDSVSMPRVGVESSPTTSVACNAVANDRFSANDGRQHLAADASSRPYAIAGIRLELFGSDCPRVQRIEYDKVSVRAGRDYALLWIHSELPRRHFAQRSHQRGESNVTALRFVEQNRQQRFESGSPKRRREDIRTSGKFFFATARRMIARQNFDRSLADGVPKSISVTALTERRPNFRKRTKPFWPKLFLCKAQILRARFENDALSLLERHRCGAQTCRSAQVHDIQRTIRTFRELKCSKNRDVLCRYRTATRVGRRRTVSGFFHALLERIDQLAVLSVNHHDAILLRDSLHGVSKSLVSDHTAGVFVRHQGFE